MIYIDIKTDDGEMTVSTRDAFTIIYEEPINRIMNVISYQEERSIALMMAHVLYLIKDFQSLAPEFPEYIRTALEEPVFQEAPIVPPVGSGATLQDALEDREQRREA
jgi:hypothetical protein